ncbi:MAG: glutathione S-transferase, partial [Pseudomonadales bacterium]
MELVIGNKNYSSWSLRPWILMDVFGLVFEERHISLMTPQMHQQMTPWCPNFKVPVLLDGEHKVWDSLAICEYLNERYLAGKGWPQEVLDRAQARAICAEMHSGFSGLRSQFPMN